MAENTDDSGAPLVNDNPVLQEYYASLESRLGYRLVLGDRRHFGYYDSPNAFPLPVGRAMRRMEDKMLEALRLPAGSRLLDAGCGMGFVAVHLASHYGMRITAFDVVERHVRGAQRNVARAIAAGRLSAWGSEHGGQVTAQRMDYHHLESLATESYDGIYCMETLVHATDPDAVLAGFYRLLRPGGHIALFEYDNVLQSSSNNGSSSGDDDDDSDIAPPPADLVTGMHQVNLYSAMPTNARARPGLYKELLEAAGFEDVEVRDYSANIRPFLRLFWLMAIVPYFFVTLFGLQKYFVNVVAGYHGYRGQQYWRYLAISATKPNKPSGKKSDAPSTKAV